MTSTDRKLLSELKAIVLRHLPDATVLLYGSTARNERRPDSDYDVLVLTDMSLPRAKKDLVHDEIYTLELEYDVVISTFFRSKDEWHSPLSSVTPFYRNVEKEAIIL